MIQKLLVTCTRVSLPLRRKKQNEELVSLQFTYQKAGDRGDKLCRIVIVSILTAHPEHHCGGGGFVKTVVWELNDGG